MKKGILFVWFIALALSGFQAIKTEDNRPWYSPRRAAAWFGYGDSDAQEMEKYRRNGDSFMGRFERKPTDKGPIQVKVKRKVKDDAGKDQEREEFYALYNQGNDLHKNEPTLVKSEPVVMGHFATTSTRMPGKGSAGVAANAFLEYGTKQGRREGAVAGAITTAGIVALGGLGYYGANWAYNKYMVKQLKHVEIAIDHAEKASKALTAQIAKAKNDNHSTDDDKKMLGIYEVANNTCANAYTRMRASIKEHNNNKKK